MKDLSDTYFPFGCDYCDGKVQLRKDVEIFGEDRGRMLWVCENFPECNTYVKAHAKPEFNYMPIGTLADPNLRKLREDVHQNFDHFWMPLDGESFRRIYTVCDNPPHEIDGIKPKPRMVAYWWLANEMDMDYYSCAISKFNEQQCRQAISICKKTAEKFNYLIPEKYLK